MLHLHCLALAGALSIPAADPPDERVIEVPGSDVRLTLWDEGEPGYSISLDGESVAIERRTSYELLMRRARFDPARGWPSFEGSPLEPAGGVYIVQFHTQPLPEFREGLRRLGASVHAFLANHAHLVRMDEETRALVEALPYVRAVGAYHPEYRLEPGLLAGLREGTPSGIRRYDVQLLEGGSVPARRLARRIARLGGRVEHVETTGRFLRATLSADQLREVARLEEVLWIDPEGPPGQDIDLVREISGANYVEALEGWSGQGVRGEVMGDNLDATHCDLQNPPPIFHGDWHTGSMIHGTASFGILFGDGTCNPAARGIIPSAQGIFAGFQKFVGSPSGDRYGHTVELVDPAGVYRAVLQTAGWGDPHTTSYTAKSAEMDAILFDLDIVVTQSHGNTGSPMARPQGWAKNILSVGGILHRNTLTLSDDAWSFGASAGPAEDGRVKPDLVHFYDNILTLAPGGGYSAFFGGTSATTAIVAGYAGLFHQLWHEGIFANPTGADVFESRPHATTARAMLINTAQQWPFSGAGHDLSRMHQGWGMPDLRNLYDLSEKIVFVDETDVLGNLQGTAWEVDVPAGEPALKATLVYSDPLGTTSSSQHRINDLTLKLTSPSATVYWGNHGLLEGNWSTPGGGPNTIDVVENVFVQNPETGAWRVEVLADEINQDSHVETPELDADYALVVSGVEGGAQATEVYCTAKMNSAGCTPSISTGGTPSAHPAVPFSISASEVVSNKNGMLFYGLNGRHNLPFLGGTLCVRPPLKRTPVQNSGGNPPPADCSGAFAFDFNAWIRSGADAALVPGATFDAQWWHRDPGDPHGVGLTDAVEGTIREGI